jgi:hypothetical protein
MAWPSIATRCGRNGRRRDRRTDAEAAIGSSGGEVAGGQAFGPFVSRDITPFEDGKPAGLTFKEFLHVIRTGEDPHHPGQVLQVMPWPVYQTMSDDDLRAIYVYLSAIPAIPANICGVPSV